MGAIRNIVIAVSVISALTFVALFGQLPALRKTPVGWLHRLLRHHIPAALARLDEYATGGKISTAATRLGNYLFYKKNPVVLIIFLVLLTGSAALFLQHALPLLPTRFITPIPVLLVLPYAFTWLSAFHKGHHINSNTHQDRMHDYPYDHLLFRPGYECSTCHLTKPARSKHCSLCGTCVAMCDHHCPWINNCVGRGNYRYFLALLFFLGVLEVYGAYLSWWILKPHFQQIDPANSIFSSAYLRDVLRAATIAVNVGGISIAGVGMLTAATGALPFGLLLYHCYLIWAGMTTNESQKWADWREDMRDGWVFKAHRKALQRHDSLHGHGGHQLSYPKQSNGSVSGMFRTDEEPFIPWSMHSDQVVIFREDGRPPPGEEALWTRIWKLEDVDNIYDLGGWTNFMEVLRGR